MCKVSNLEEYEYIQYQTKQKYCKVFSMSRYIGIGLIHNSAMIMIKQFSKDA